MFVVIGVRRCHLCVDVRCCLLIDKCRLILMFVVGWLLSSVGCCSRIGVRCLVFVVVACCWLSCVVVRCCWCVSFAVVCFCLRFDVCCRVLCVVRCLLFVVR